MPKIRHCSIQDAQRVLAAVTDYFHSSKVRKIIHPGWVKAARFIKSIAVPRDMEWGAWGVDGFLQTVNNIRGIKAKIDAHPAEALAHSEE